MLSLLATGGSVVSFMSGGRAPTRRRAIVVVQVVVLLIVLVGFAALTVDVGTLYRARSELQAAADAGALAAASTFTSDEMLQVRLEGEGGSGYADVVSTLQDRATDLAGRNKTLNDSTTLLTSDVVVGWIDVTSATSTIDPTAQSSTHNAVRVAARRSSGVNGPVEFFFARASAC